MKDFNLDLFKNGLSEFNIDLKEEQINQFIKYYKLLIEWNSFMNLTAITDWDEVVVKHFLDSLSIVKFINMTDVSYFILDLGTGAGFPGIPLKIAFPNLNIVLADSLNKRVKFLNTVISELGLINIEAIHGRAEDLARNKNYRESFDLVVSRAVANMSTLAEYCLPFVKVNGKFISYKSEKIFEEYEEAKNAITLLGGGNVEHIDFNLPSTDLYRNIFCINKLKPTPNKYPRKAGTPAKEPL